MSAICQCHPQKLWTQSHDGCMRYEWMNSNGVGMYEMQVMFCTQIHTVIAEVILSSLVECFNGVLKGSRLLPITTMTLMIYYRLVTYHNRRKQEIDEAISNGISYTKYVMDKLTYYEQSARRHQVTLINRDIGEFEVLIGRHGDRMHKRQQHPSRHPKGSGVQLQ
ncbi:hypothetical protein Scep_017317 [Stephania cephalantha]|uniref:Uncharacterized protein n=1 Tax=Stephania cephalantha TaxID=152367 RepID=A0AAP0IPC8_9MAGN